MTVPEVILYNKTSVIYIGNFNPFENVTKDGESFTSDIYIITLKYPHLSPHPPALKLLQWTKHQQGLLDLISWTLIAAAQKSQVWRSVLLLLSLRQFSILVVLCLLETQNVVGGLPVGLWSTNVKWTAVQSFLHPLLIKYNKRGRVYVFPLSKMCYFWESRIYKTRIIRIIRGSGCPDL